MHRYLIAVAAVLAFNATPAEAAGATVVDPIVIPDLKKLHAITLRDPEGEDVALKVYLSRNPNSPFKGRADIAKSPVTNKGIPPSKAINLNTFLVYTSVITVPAGFTTDDIPVGMTFFGLADSEPTLFKLAYAYEQATHHRKPPASTPDLP